MASLEGGGRLQRTAIVGRGWHPVVDVQQPPAPTPYGEPPYGVIARALLSGRVIPFLGAGVNYGTRPPGASWENPSSAYLPNGAELANLLADDCNLPSQESRDRDDLAKVASYYVESSARDALYALLRSVFDRNLEPAPIHTYLATIERPMLIVTTNYDDLIEQAFQKAHREYDLVVHPTDEKDHIGSVWHFQYGADAPVLAKPNKLRIDLSKRTVIYKMHGTTDRTHGGAWDSYVISEDDYINFLDRLGRRTAVPSQFAELFGSHHFLFLGYGLQDWNLRLVLKTLKRVAPKQYDNTQSWAIQWRPSVLDIELWRARDVRIYNVDINDFVQKLRTNAS